MMLKHHQQSQISRNFDVPINSRTLVIYDETTRQRETRKLWELTSDQLSMVKFDSLTSRLATREELKLEVANETVLVEHLIPNKLR